MVIDGRDLVERDAVEEDLHVAQGVDGDAAHADLAERARRVAVVAHQVGKSKAVERPRLPLLRAGT
jgi:hypothetical protein